MNSMDIDQSAYVALTGVGFVRIIPTEVLLDC